MKKTLRFFMRGTVFVVLAVLFLAAVPVTAVYVEVSTSDELEQAIFNSNQSTTTPYTIVINDDIEVLQTLNIKGQVTLTTNKSRSSELTRDNPNTSLFIVEDGGDLTIIGNSSSGEMKELILIGDNPSQIALVQVNGKFTMGDGSTLKDNIAYSKYGDDGIYGGGVFVNTDGTFTLDGGTITGNEVHKGYEAGYGGGVYVRGKFIMNGGRVENNYADNQGGGVYVHSGTFDMNGATLSGNSADGSGGGVYIFSGRFDMIDSTITGNFAGNNGGGVYFSSGIFNMEKSSITGNEAKVGGGVYVSYDGTQFTVRDPVVIKDNTGGNVYLSSDDDTKFAMIHIEGLLLSGSSIGISPTLAAKFYVVPIAKTSISMNIERLFSDSDKIGFAYDVAGQQIISLPPKQETQSSSVWLSSPAPSAAGSLDPAGNMHGSNTLTHPNGGTVNFPDGFPFSAVVLPSAGEVIQTSPSLAVDSFPKTSSQEILYSADITADPAPQTDTETRLNFDVPIGKVPEGYAVNVYHQVTDGSGYQWVAEQVVETGRNNDVIYYTAIVHSLSPFVIVVEEGGAEPAKDYGSDYVPPLDYNPVTSTPAESVGFGVVGVLAGLGVVCTALRRR